MRPWWEDFEEADRSSLAGDPDNAMAIVQKCLRDNAGNNDPLIWSNWYFYNIRLRVGGIAAAKDYVGGLVRNPPTLGIALHTSAFLIDHLSKAGDHDGACRAAANLNDAIRKWVASSPTSLDFPLHLLVRAVDAIARAKAEEAAPLLAGRHGRSEQGRRVGSVAQNVVDLPSPTFMNAKAGFLEQSVRGWNSLLPDFELREFDGCSAFFDGSSMFIRDQSQRLIRNVPLPNFYNEVINRVASSLPIVSIKGRTLLIADYYGHGHNISHWTLDWLSRIAAADLMKAGYEYILVSLPLSEEFERESLKRFSHDLQVIVPDNSTLYVFENLLVPSDITGRLFHPGHGGSRTILDHVGFKISGRRPARGERRLYVPRRASRRVVNDEDLFGCLSRAGFERIDTDTMSYDDQVRTFGTASAVIGPHGAALTNILFCPEECAVMELFPRFGGSLSYYVLSVALGLDYSCYVDTITDPNFDVSATGDVAFNNADLLVDVPFVEKWVNSLGR